VWDLVSFDPNCRKDYCSLSEQKDDESLTGESDTAKIFCFRHVELHEKTFEMKFIDFLIMTLNCEHEIFFQ